MKRHPRTEGGEHTEVHGVPSLVVDHDTAPISKLHLLCVAGNQLGESFVIDTPPVVIGRSSGQVILRAPEVSRTHARITQRLGRYWIEDLESANGTFLNGAQVHEPTELRFGDRVQLGSTILVFTRNDELEQRLRQLQKIEAMGALVKGIAHDFNNTLQTLHSCIAELGETATPEQVVLLAEMTEATESATGLVRRLLRVGRTKPETLDLLDLEVVVEAGVALGRRVMPPTIHIDVVPSPPVMVRGSRSELEQAVLNLLVNARDAMPEGGRIEVRRTVYDLDRLAAHANHLPGEGRYVELAVRDEGTGMDAATAARACEPFFTTKSGRGAGLGLAMVFSAGTNHGGTIAIDSQLGVGTTVRILLPVVI